MIKQYEYPLPKRCRIDSITIRETFGPDEDEAVTASEVSGNDPKDELVGLSIVAVDGKPCLPGDSGYDKWPTKTRGVVKALFNRLNDYSAKELTPLIEDAEENGTESVDDSVHTKYGFPENCGLEFVVLREMVETDERAATAAGKDVTEDMIRRCVVSTNRGGLMSLSEIKALNTKTRNIISIYWTGMNFVSEDELTPLAMAAEAAQEAMQTEASKTSVATSDDESSQSGSGSQDPVDAGSQSPLQSSEISPE